MTLEKLSNLTQYHRPDYYTLLLSNHSLIIAEVGKTSKNAVSKALHINPSQFSGIYQCIIAHGTIQDERLDNE